MIDIKDYILKFLKLDNLLSHLSGYLESKVELIKYELREEVIKILAHGLMIVALFLLGVLFLVFFSMGLANYLNTLYGNPYTGYWIISVCYGVIGLIIALFRNGISRFLETHLMNQVKHKRK